LGREASRPDKERIKSSMKINILFSVSVSATILLASSCSENSVSDKKSHTDLSDYEVHGKVRSIELKSFKRAEQNKDSLVRTGQAYTVNFTETGLITDIIHYDLPGVVKYHEFYKRDKSGALIEIVQKDGNGKLFSKASCKNDSAGNTIETSGFRPAGEFLGKYTNTYDRAGNMIDFKTYDENLKLISAFKWKYDASGHKTEEERTSPSGEMRTKVIFIWGSDDLLAEQTVSGPALTIKMKYSYLKDEQGNWIEKTEKVYSTSDNSLVDEKVVKRKVIYY
jgi:hypothetical protein